MSYPISAVPPGQAAMKKVDRCLYLTSEVLKLSPSFQTPWWPLKETNKLKTLKPGTQLSFEF